MSNVIPFPTKPPASPPSIVRITAGLVTASTDPRDVGRFLYFLEYVEPDGGCMNVWDGPSHEEALAAAREWECDDIVIVDETVNRLH